MDERFGKLLSTFSSNAWHVCVMAAILLKLLIIFLAEQMGHSSRCPLGELY
jgi:hypothetical protein